MADTQTPERNTDGDLVCPECGDTFKLALHLGVHRKNKHGVAGKNAHKKRRGDSTPTGRKPQPRKERVARTLREVCDLVDDIRGRDTTEIPEHLSDVIRRDADQLATLITGLAEAFNPVKAATDVATRVLAPALAASGVLRWLLRGWRRQMQARQLEEEQLGPELTPDEAAAMSNGEALAEPWRGDVYVPPGAGVPASVHDEPAG